ADDPTVPGPDTGDARHQGRGAPAAEMRIRYLIAAAIGMVLYSVALTVIGLWSALGADAAGEDVDLWPIGALVGAIFFGVVLALLVYVVAVEGDQIGRAMARHEVRSVALAQGGVLVVVDLVLVVWLGTSGETPWPTALVLLGVLLLATVPGWLVVGVVPWFVGRSETGDSSSRGVDEEPSETDEDLDVRREIAIQEALDRVRARENR
ncbi:hypothetical protein ACFT1B_34345, partial [Streptomyces griseoincarnatus]